MSPQLHFDADNSCGRTEKNPRPQARGEPRIATDRPTRPLLGGLARESRCSLVELVELEAARVALRAPAIEEVVGLLVVQDGTGPRRRGRVVADHGAAGETLELLDGPEALL